MTFLISHLFDSTGKQTPSLLIARPALYRLGHRAMYGRIRRFSRMNTYTPPSATLPRCPGNGCLLFNGGREVASVGHFKANFLNSLHTQYQTNCHNLSAIVAVWQTPSDRPRVNVARQWGTGLTPDPTRNLPASKANLQALSASAGNPYITQVHGAPC